MGVWAPMKNGRVPTENDEIYSIHSETSLIGGSNIRSHWRIWSVDRFLSDFSLNLLTHALMEKCYFKFLLECGQKHGRRRAGYSRNPFYKTQR